MKHIIITILAFSSSFGIFAQNVIQSHFPVTGITLSPQWTPPQLVIGDSLQLTATVQPYHATNRSITWTSSNTNVAIVNNTGLITAVSNDTVTITARTVDGNFTSRIRLRVVYPCRCNRGVTPGWGNSLGTVSFDSRGHNVEIQGTGSNSHIHQIWSGAVTTTNCQKTTFNGGHWCGGTGDHNFNPDCRSNPDSPGDLFSWCAVVWFADQLCPHPWRVPSMQDFINLNAVLSEQIAYCLNTWSSATTVVAKFINRWGGAFGGILGQGGQFISHLHGIYGLYWSLSETNASSGFGLTITNTTGGRLAVSLGGAGKNSGRMLRCVR